MNVNSGGTLGGGGTISGAVTINAGGTLSPGNSPGQLHVGALTLASNSTTVIELAGTTPGSGYDQVLVAGALTLGGNLSVSLVNGFTPSLGQKFFILDNVSNNALGTTGIFANAPATLLVGSYLFAVDYADRDPANGDLFFNDVSLGYGVVPVPEPSTWVAASAACLLVMVQRLRRKRSPEACCPAPPPTITNNPRPLIFLPLE